MVGASACGGDDSGETGATNAEVTSPESAAAGTTPPSDPRVETIVTTRHSTPGSVDGVSERCLDCVGVPPAGVAAQLGLFTGGGAGGDCGLVGEIVGLGDDEFYVGLLGEEAVVGSHEWFCINGVDPAQPLEILVEGPDGTTDEIHWVGGARSDRGLALDGSGSTEAGNLSGSLILSLPPGLPLGTYRISAVSPGSEDSAPDDGTGPSGLDMAPPEVSAPETTGVTSTASLGDQGSAVTEDEPSTSDGESGATETTDSSPAQLSSASSFRLVAGAVPRFESSLPTRFQGESTGAPGHAPGGVVIFLLSGFVPGSTVEPVLYFHTDDQPCGSWYCFATTLPPVVADGDGAAVFEFPTVASDPEGLYCVTTSSSDSCSSEFDFSGEFFIGEPFVY